MSEKEQPADVADPQESNVISPVGRPQGGFAAGNQDGIDPGEGIPDEGEAQRSEGAIGSAALPEGEGQQARKGGC